MPNMLCIACTVGDDIVEFPTVADYVAHTKGGHISRPVKVVPPPVKPPSLSATELKAQQEGTQKVTESSQTRETEAKTTPLPLVLEYTYKGQCSLCMSEPRTIMVSVGDKTVAVCFCTNCNKELKQQQVIAIEKQFAQREKKK